MGSRLTSNEYTTIKELLRKGLNGKTVARIVKRGTGTVSTVKNSMDFSEYKETRGKEPEPKETIQTQLPLERPKKNSPELREDMIIKFNQLMDSLEAWRKATPGMDFRKEIAISRAKVHLEEARLWLKETL